MAPKETAPTEHRIFGITEMLEAILDNLPQRQLLLSKRVCKTWNEVIEKSEKLQKALFFVAKGEARYMIDKAGTLIQDPSTPAGPLMKPAANPLLTPVLDDLYKRKYNFDKMGELIFPDPYTYGDGNWRRMLLTQPAITSLYIKTKWISEADGTRSPYAFLEKVVNPHGITIGDYIKRLESSRRKKMGFHRIDYTFIVSIGIW